MRKQRETIRRFILDHVEQNPSTVASMAAEAFGYSRPAINRYMSRLVEEGLLEATGRTKAKYYKLRPIKEWDGAFEIDYLWSEEDIWRNHFAPLLEGVGQNIIDLCHYGVTEMVNNVLDHATSPRLLLSYEQNARFLEMMVVDQGIGIFQKIQKDFNLPDPRMALLELSKGKLTSDKKRHAGEGIYFTSRMFDVFSIHSGALFYTKRKTEGSGWLLEIEDKEQHINGTHILMKLYLNTDRTTKSVFDETGGDNLRFRGTHVPVSLAQYPGEQLVSRSQAKRLLSRFDKFSEVFLDFKDVPYIGQAFADEVFRVFANENPNVKIRVVRAEPDVQKMIDYVRSNAPDLE